jgi:hypothetical protein
MSTLSFIFSNTVNQNNNFDEFNHTKVSFLDDGTAQSPKGLKNGFVIMRDNQILELRNNIDKKVNWAEVMATFIDNYNDLELDNGFYKWGQLVPEDAEYLCKDCGYILDLKEGDIFPICEVCLSGEPDGPSTDKEGYWEKI